MRKLAILLGLLSLPLLAPSPARADMPGDVPDKVRFEFGGMGANAYTDAAVGSKTAGIDYLGLEASLAANGNVTDANGVPVTGEVDEKVSISFPVPQIGLQLDWALTKRLALKFYNRLLYANFAGIEGSIGQSAIRFYWYFSRHAGINVGIDKDTIDLKKYTSGDTVARFRYVVQGPSLYFNFAF